MRTLSQFILSCNRRYEKAADAFVNLQPHERVVVRYAKQGTGLQFVHSIRDVNDIGRDFEHLGDMALGYYAVKEAVLRLYQRSVRARASRPDIREFLLGQLIINSSMRGDPKEPGAMWRLRINPETFVMEIRTSFIEGEEHSDQIPFVADSKLISDTQTAIEMITQVLASLRIASSLEALSGDDQPAPNDEAIMGVILEAFVGGDPSGTIRPRDITSLLNSILGGGEVRRGPFSRSR